MSNYTQNVSYGPKDALTTGDAAKRIKGVEIDAEFAEISSAISSKEDSANKGAANGYCGLDAGGLVLKADLPATTVYTDALNTFTFGQNITAAAPYLNFVETGVAANNGTWRLLGDATSFYGYAMADDLGSGSSWLVVARSGTTIASVSLGGTAIYLNGAVAISGSATLGGYGILTTASGLSASNLDSGTIPDARVSLNNVQQHQASLSIAETQIIDGSVFPRIGSTETITGSWAFNGFSGTANGNITRSGNGAHTYLIGSGNTGGGITLSTSAATGSPSAGDIWIQYTA